MLYAPSADKFVSIMFRLLKHSSQLNRHPTLAVCVDAWDTFKSFYTGLACTRPRGAVMGPYYRRMCVSVSPPQLQRA